MKEFYVTMDIADDDDWAEHEVWQYVQDLVGTKHILVLSETIGPGEINK